jgi:ABC-type lipopolysaccharide export system ATPase subunit
MSELIKFEEVKKRVLIIQGEQILIDRDVAELYGVEVKRINEAVKRNPDKFPDGYVITLSDSDKSELVAICDRFILLKHSSVLPSACHSETSTQKTTTLAPGVLC